MEDQKINLVLESLSQIEEMMAEKLGVGDVEEIRRRGGIVMKAYNYSEFKEIRALNGVEGLHKLGKQYILNKQIQGKSGSSLFFTGNLRFIIKTIRRCEFLCIRGMMEEYRKYILENPKSLLCKILGCYSLYSEGKEEYFIVMESMLGGLGIQEVYDLKGASVKRKGYSMSSLKEVDWIRNKKGIHLGNRKEAIISQIKSDVRFLRKHRIMDYSFLVSFNSRGKEDFTSLPRNSYHSHTSEDKDIRFGIVDILTQWTFTKRMERLFHIFCCKPNSSCLNPDAYMDRFLMMIESNIFK
ncbi:phosphatidylinositol-4-phosphate-5-kinase [Encephalitozoon intestinalis ATCC 50506]|uniref:Phosphatidylinositol-4-phosphate-5-kinase n=1 Tax=Encephalitozoon intestinalis (strain ATCC 50506) TaxID=876142 RepID=E0S634_ENCIT|nr:phosphatidylinositol-4-phosphate-5-kinase [Encephalitozoon intestinalis ATCC 50506]ADM11169.1 phosphatidylinositol-4-phosphate-5-kinase [Encephalitozoon intestinalis ATCC 50506]UTX44835.1 phosphatidylinositol-4-phosphate-5-kinase [Encephalitozoon intestinalis]